MQMPLRYSIVLLTLIASNILSAQVSVDLQHFNKQGKAKVQQVQHTVTVSWPVDTHEYGQVQLDMEEKHPLFKSIDLSSGKQWISIVKNQDPVFILSIGKRDLVSQNGWNIFFDKVPLKPFLSTTISLHKKDIAVRSSGSRTIISIGEVSAPYFKGHLEITLYEGSALFNIAAVVSTQRDSTAILYDAGLISGQPVWKQIAWATVGDTLHTYTPQVQDTGKAEAVKYRTIIGKTATGSMAIFPAPHQYFYPLDEAFNLGFTWHGNQYRHMVDGYGIGIRQDPYGDKRFVPWFNAPPGTNQRLNFFCLLSKEAPAAALQQVKRFTHNDTYVPLAGYKTMSSHFHNEFIMSVVREGKPVPVKPSFVEVLKQTGIDIVHLAEFHYTAHPKGPDSLRLKELKALFEQCQRLSTDSFLLLPGEEPNEFFGGHWLELFPKPVYWVMSRKEGEPMVTNDGEYGTVYHIGNATEMLELLQKENGLAWTAHPRTKGSTGFPDQYKAAHFFRSDRFLGAAWKAMPADLSQPRLGKRVLDLMDDMNNWGLSKKVLAEADLFSIEPENEMYAHLNVNYLQLAKLPQYTSGWQPILTTLQNGRFFSTTGEVLLPTFTINGAATGDTIRLEPGKKADISFRVSWTFPLQFAEIISGDGKAVYRHHINLDQTLPFSEQTFTTSIDLTGRKWARLEVWDAAVNGAYTQTIYFK